MSGGGHAAGDMRVTGECVQDEDGVIAGLVEGTPGFVTDGHLRQSHAGLELQVADVQLTQIALRFGVLGAGAATGMGAVTGWLVVPDWLVLWVVMGFPSLGWSARWCRV